MTRVLDFLSNCWASIDQSFLISKPRWTVNHAPDMEGKIVIVTGGNSGIGKELVKSLLLRNATVYMACRNEDSARDAISELQAITDKEAIFLQLDLEDLQSIKNAATEFMKKETYLHVLYNNAGILMPPKSLLTPAGIDLTFATNVLGHFYLTKLLISTMLSTFKETGINPRVVTTTSVTEYLALFDLDSLHDGVVRSKFPAIHLYGQSKLGNQLFAQELAERYGGQGIISILVNPGNIKNTQLNRNLQGDHLNRFWRFAGRIVQVYPVHWGALQLLYAGTCHEGEGFNGKMVIPWGRLGSPRKGLRPSLKRDLWIWLERQVEEA